jgi:hypothetical protein
MNLSNLHGCCKIIVLIVSVGACEKPWIWKPSLSPWKTCTLADYKKKAIAIKFVINFLVSNYWILEGVISVLPRMCKYMKIQMVSEHVLILGCSHTVEWSNRISKLTGTTQMILFCWLSSQVDLWWSSSEVGVVLINIINHLVLCPHL